MGLNGYMVRVRIIRKLWWVQYYADDHKVVRCLAILVMGDSTLLLRHVNC